VHPSDLSCTTRNDLHHYVPEPGRRPEQIPHGTSFESTNGAFHKGPYFYYQVSSFIPLPPGSAIAIPKIQHKFEPEDATARAIREKRLAAVREALGHSWKGYEEHAWLFDEVIPISGGYRTTNGGWGASMVDSLDTLWIMSMQAEFEQLPLNVFETTIRYLGGFLNKLRGAMDLTNIE
jgi:mannosyl-oligosaccharide alpha-1,2-mannosidase